MINRNEIPNTKETTTTHNTSKHLIFIKKETNSLSSIGDFKTYNLGGKANRERRKRRGRARITIIIPISEIIRKFIIQIRKAF